MICADCGKELKSLGEIPTSLWDTFSRANTTINDTDVLFKSLPLKNLKDKGDVFNTIYRALTDVSVAKLKLAKVYNQLSDLYNISAEDISIIDAVAYTHIKGES